MHAVISTQFTRMTRMWTKRQTNSS